MIHLARTVTTYGSVRTQVRRPGPGFGDRGRRLSSMTRIGVAACRRRGRRCLRSCQPGPVAMGNLRPAGGGLLDLRVPWSTLAGESGEPGQLSRIGPITPEQARHLADLAASDATVQWRVIVTDPTAGPWRSRGFCARSVIALTAHRRSGQPGAAGHRDDLAGARELSRQRGSAGDPATDPPRRRQGGREGQVAGCRSTRKRAGVRTGRPVRVTSHRRGCESS